MGYVYRTLTLIIYNDDGSLEWLSLHGTNVGSWLGDLQCKEEVLIKLKNIVIHNGNAEVCLDCSGWEGDWKLSLHVVVWL